MINQKFDNQPPTTKQQKQQKKPIEVSKTAMQQAHQDQVQVQTLPPAYDTGGNQSSKYSRKLLILGILQIIFSGLSVVTGLAECLAWHACTYVASAIWGGILFYLPAGILVLLAAKIVSARKGLAIAGLVMSILAALVALVSFALYTAAFGLNLTYYGGYGGPAAADALTSLVSLVEVIVAIISAVHCGLVLKEPQILTTSYQQQVQPNPYSSQPPNMAAPGGYAVNQMYTQNKQELSVYTGEEKGGL